MVFSMRDRVFMLGSKSDSNFLLLTITVILERIMIIVCTGHEYIQ